MNRRDFQSFLLAACAPPFVHAVQAREPQPAQPWAELERRCQGRLGVAVLRPDGTLIGRRENERFPMCSTFKWVLAAQVLQRIQRGEEQMNRRIRYGRDALVAYSPVTEKHVREGLTIGELCEATVTLSDNGAANLLLAASGGPPAVTRFARDAGDTVTRLDRTEPQMNEGRPGDERDTTSPAAMARLLRTVLTGPALSDAGREQLARWMEACQTDGKRLRANLPAGWRLGSKTGTGPRGSTNDVGFFQPVGGGASTFVAVYITDAKGTMAEREAAIAAVAASTTRA